MRWKALVGALALLAAVAVILGFFWPFKNGPEALRLPGVVEIQEVRLGSKVGGRVAEVKVAEGELVTEGQALVVFDLPELKAQLEQQQARVTAAEADAEKARAGARPQEKEAGLAAAAASWFRWQRLDAGARPEEIRQARSDLDAAAADLKWAQEEFAREERLFQKGGGKRADYDAARATLARGQARFNAVQARLDLFLAGSRVEEIAEAAAEFHRARAAYDLLLAGTRSEELTAAEARAAEAQGRLHELEAHVAEGVVRAPSKTIVEVLAVRKGDLVAPNQPIVRVLRAEDLWVKVYVPETELGKVRLGQTIDVTVDSYPDHRFSGKVMQIASVSEFTPRNVQSADERKHQVFGVKVRVDDPQGVFKSGMAAQVTVPLHD